MNSTINYIIKFLLGKENEDLAQYVSYGEADGAKIIIKKSNFFNSDIYLTEKSLPILPLKRIEDVPILFGDRHIERKNGMIIVWADFIASAYFLISRYEECVRRDVRDRHGRFIGKESVLYKAGVLNCPVIEKYGMLLRNYLREIGGGEFRIIEPSKGFSHVYLTHDVDQIWTWDNYYRAGRTFIKRVLHKQPKKLQPFKAVYNYKKYDPCYTFEKLVEWDKKVMEVMGKNICTDIYFLKGCKENKAAQDIPYWNKAGEKKTKNLVEFIKANQSPIGLHISYDASLERELIVKEKKFLEAGTQDEITCQRNHYLASREPEDFQTLSEAGIEEDFTMGYADTAGFRLGTCRRVRWINPITKELTKLVLHPMTIMECTLNGEEYMNIQKEEEAFAVIKSMVDEVFKYNGEVVFLWHNNSISDEHKSYHAQLYKRTLDYLISM